jgi:hypothetical protein
MAIILFYIQRRATIEIPFFGRYGTMCNLITIFNDVKAASVLQIRHFSITAYEQVKPTHAVHTKFHENL